MTRSDAGVLPSGSLAPGARVLGVAARRFGAILMVAATVTFAAGAGVAMMGVDGDARSADVQKVVLEPMINDPIEPANRGSFAFTKGAVDMAIEPLGQGWSLLVPRVGRKGLDHLSRNLAFPVRLVALLLQGRVADSGQETGHFAVNSTLGVAGLWDPARRFGIPTYEEDVGQAFGAWGMGHGFYLFIPLMGPSSGRDGMGRLLDSALSPSSYVPGLNWFFAFNRISLHLDSYASLRAAERDLYSVSRTVWAVQRQTQVRDYVIPEAAFAHADADLSVGALALRAGDEDFLSCSRDGSARIPATGGRLPYSAWMQKRPAPLVLLLPGIGGHRQGTTVVALAEVLFREGYSVVAISSVFHAEFMFRALTHPYPGYTPADVGDVHAALVAVVAAVHERWGERITEISLAGCSMGGMQALFLAAGEPVPLPGGKAFARVVAINPPVDLLAAAERFDRFYDIPLRWPAEERAAHLEDVALRACSLVSKGLPAGRPLPFSREESLFLVGLSGRDVLATALHARAVRDAKGAPHAVARDAIEAMNSVSFQRYLDEMLLPVYQAGDPGRPLGLLREECSLRAVAATLAKDPRVRIVTNADDFVLGDGGADWLVETLGTARVHVFVQGGHLGNLDLPEVQRAIVDALGGKPDHEPLTRGPRRAPARGWSAWAGSSPGPP